MDAPDKKPTLFYGYFSPDGKWIAYASNNAQETNVVLNWFEELKARVPVE